MLLLNHVSNAFRNATPDHVEEAQRLALAHFKCISCGGVFRSLIRISGGVRVTNERQIELLQVLVEEVWVVHALFEKSVLGVGRLLHSW